MLTAGLNRWGRTFLHFGTMDLLGTPTRRSVARGRRLVSLTGEEPFSLTEEEPFSLTGENPSQH